MEDILNRNADTVLENSRSDSVTIKEMVVLRTGGLDFENLMRIGGGGGV